MIFEILHIESPNGKSEFVFAKSMNNNVEISITDKATLGGIPIKPFISQPRTTGKNGNLTFDVFAFHVKNQSDLTLLKVGQQAELIP